MAKIGNMHKLLIQERDRLRQKISELQGELRGIERAISLSNGEAQDNAFLNGAAIARKPRANIKETVLSIVQEYSDQGIVAAKLVDVAKEKNISLDRNSVSSLLSRLKREGVLEYDDKRGYTINLVK